MTQPVTAPTDLDSGLSASPLVDPNAWSSITIAGVTVGPKDGSGKIVLKRAGRPYKWQIKDASGQEGGTSTYRGKKPPEWEIEFHLWTDRHFTVWQQLSLGNFVYDASKTSVDPVDVYHPGLAMVGISQLLVDHLSVPEQQGDRKLWIATLKVHEYFPPIATNVTQSPSGSAGTNPNPPGEPPDTGLAAAQAYVASGEAQAIQSGVISPVASGLP